MANTAYRRDFMDWGGLPYGDMVHPDIFNYGDADDGYPGLEKAFERSLGDYDRKGTFPLSSFSDVVQDDGITWKTTVSGHVYITGYYTYINPQSFTLNDGNYLYYTTGNAFLESSALGVHGILIGKRIGTTFQNLLNGIKTTGTTGYLHYHGEQQYFIAPVDFNTTGHFLTKVVFSTGAGAIIGSDDYDLHATIGRGIIGFATGMSDQFTLAHRDVFTSTNYALTQTSLGYTKINSSSAVSLRSADTEYFGISSTGAYSPTDNYTFAYGYSKLYSASLTGYFVHRSISTPGTQFAICQNAAGYTCVNAVTALSLRSVNTEYIGISATGVSLISSNIDISSDYFGVSSTGINLLASSIISTDGDYNYVLGRSTISCGTGDQAIFCHRDFNLTTGYALKQDNDGSTSLNAYNGKKVYIKTGDAIVARFDGRLRPIPLLPYVTGDGTSNFGFGGTEWAYAGIYRGWATTPGSAYMYIYYPFDFTKSGLVLRIGYSGDVSDDGGYFVYYNISTLQYSNDGGAWTSTLIGSTGASYSSVSSELKSGFFIPYDNITPVSNYQYRLCLRIYADETVNGSSGFCALRLYSMAEV